MAENVDYVARPKEVRKAAKAEEHDSPSPEKTDFIHPYTAATVTPDNRLRLIDDEYFQEEGELCRAVDLGLVERTPDGQTAVLRLQSTHTLIQPDIGAMVVEALEKQIADKKKPGYAHIVRERHPFSRLERRIFEKEHGYALDHSLVRQIRGSLGPRRYVLTKVIVPAREAEPGPETAPETELEGSDDFSEGAEGEIQRVE
jgi:hypothetical protein